MVHGWKQGGQNVNNLEVICYEYDENIDDTGSRLPPGAQVVVRDVPNDCTYGNGAIAVWARVAYP
jgi:hypothetical protein